MGNELPDRVKSERMAAFLLKNGMVVEIPDLNPHWDVINRGTMYWMYKHLDKAHLTKIVSHLSRMKVPIQYVGVTKGRKSLGPNVLRKEIIFNVLPAKFYRMSRGGRKCLKCGCIDPSSGSLKCPSCDTIYSPTEMEVENG
jgi:hypothetical protein